MGFGFRFEPFRVSPSPLLSTAAHASESPPSTAKRLHCTRLRRVSVLRCVPETLTFVSRFEASPPQSLRVLKQITTAINRPSYQGIKSYRRSHRVKAHRTTKIIGDAPPVESRSRLIRQFVQRPMKKGWVEDKTRTQIL
ncbi:unnamed protein product [Brassica rapa subsp. narinosa]